MKTLITFMCFLRELGCVYDLSHTLQMYGLSDVCTCMCFFLSLLLAKRLSQPSNSHLNGFSPAGLNTHHELPQWPEQTNSHCNTSCKAAARCKWSAAYYITGVTYIFWSTWIQLHYYTPLCQALFIQEACSYYDWPALCVCSYSKH